MDKEIQRANESATNKISLLRVKYKKYRAEWENQDDDRRVFCNIYDMLIEACEDMKHVTNNFIWIAFNRRYNEELQTLDEILARFISK